MAKTKTYWYVYITDTLNNKEYLYEICPSEKLAYKRANHLLALKGLTNARVEPVKKLIEKGE